MRAQGGGYHLRGRRGRRFLRGVVVGTFYDESSIYISMKFVSSFVIYLFSLSLFSSHHHLSYLGKTTAFEACDECDDSTHDNHHHKHECVHQHCQNYSLSYHDVRHCEAYAELFLGFAGREHTALPDTKQAGFNLIRAPPC